MEKGRPVVQIVHDSTLRSLKDPEFVTRVYCISKRTLYTRSVDRVQLLMGCASADVLYLVQYSSELAIWK